MKNLPDFLVEANRLGYATDELPVRTDVDGSKVIEYEDDPYRYIDRYFGSNPFVGQIVVLEKDIPCFVMMYSGHTTERHPDVVYAFLKQALSKATAEYPYRGPSQHEDGSFTYLNNMEGTIEQFHGHETISIGGKGVYAGDYSGRLIK